MQQTFTSLSAGNIKSGVTIAGTAGDYPSSSYPLSSASATPDLDNATFNAKIKSSSTFEYWTSEGIYQTSAGNDDIIASNIKAGVTLFGKLELTQIYFFHQLAFLQ